jgi:hypothetical protein
MLVQSRLLLESAHSVLKGTDAWVQNYEDTRSRSFLSSWDKLRTGYRGAGGCSRKLWIYIAEAPNSDLGRGTEYFDRHFS